MTDPIFHMIPDAPKPVAPYSHVVERDGWLFVTGQLATDPRDDSLPLPEGIEAQTEQALNNLAAILGEAGASLANLVKTTIFYAEVDDLARLNEVCTLHAGSSTRAIGAGQRQTAARPPLLHRGHRAATYLIKPDPVGSAARVCWHT